VEYVDDEGWKILSIDEIFIAEREQYSDEESLECFDQAVNCGVGAVFYTWPLGSEDE
jgi:hypothetical protein